MRAFIISAFAFFLLTTTSCGNNTNTGSNKGMVSSETDEDSVAEVKPLFGVSDTTFSQQIQQVVDAYIRTKGALVGSNASEAQKEANSILVTLSGVNPALLPPNQKTVYEKVATGITTAAQAITKEADIEKQRSEFSKLSENVYELVKSFGTSRPMYQDYCPMALKDKGASWISEIKEIRNPYFGDQMMECGEVTEVINSK